MFISCRVSGVTDVVQLTRSGHKATTHSANHSLKEQSGKQIQLVEHQRCDACPLVSFHIGIDQHQLSQELRHRGGGPMTCRL